VFIYRQHNEPNTPNTLKSCRWISTTNTTQKEFITDEPVRFSGSKADRNAAESFVNPKQRIGPWYESYVVLVSLTAFMLYFCVFREENDIDDFLRDNVVFNPVSEVEQLKKRIVKEKADGLDTTDTEARLKKMESLMYGDQEVLEKHLKHIEKAKKTNQSVITMARD